MSESEDFEIEKYIIDSIGDLSPDSFRLSMPFVDKASNAKGNDEIKPLDVYLVSDVYGDRNELKLNINDEINDYLNYLDSLYQEESGTKHLLPAMQEVSTQLRSLADLIDRKLLEGYEK